MAGRLLTLVLVCLTLGMGIAAGLGITTALLDSQSPLGSKSLGPWVSWTMTEKGGGDPYTRAYFARRGDLPMTPVEGVSFYASSDDAGEPLSGSCSYRFNGEVPAGRIWTLNVYRKDGSRSQARAGRSTFTSMEAEPDFGTAGISIAIGSEPQEGNWLPVEAGQAFMLVLRIYDKPLGAAGLTQRTDLPQLQKRRCVG